MARESADLLGQSRATIKNITSEARSEVEQPWVRSLLDTGAAVYLEAEQVRERIERLAKSNQENVSTELQRCEAGAMEALNDALDAPDGHVGLVACQLERLTEDVDVLDDCILFDS